MKKKNGRFVAKIVTNKETFTFWYNCAFESNLKYSEPLNRIFCLPPTPVRYVQQTACPIGAMLRNDDCLHKAMGTIHWTG